MPVSISCSSVDLFLISLFAASFLFTPVSAVCGSHSALVDIAPTLAISICADGQLDNVSPAIVRVVRAPSTSQTTAAQLSLSRDSVMVQPHWPKAGPNFKVYRSDDILTVRTSKLVVIVDLRFLSIKFLDASATTPFLTEQSHSFAPDTDAASGAASFVASSVWGPLSENEAIYGGGSFQNGVIDFRNVPVNLVQFNTEVSVQPRNTFPKPRMLFSVLIKPLCRLLSHSFLPPLATESCGIVPAGLYSMRHCQVHHLFSCCQPHSGALVRALVPKASSFLNKLECTCSTLNCVSTTAAANKLATLSIPLK